jgi:multidrug resistance efflux pump
VEASTAQIRAAMERARVNLRKAELDAGVPKSVYAEFEYEQRQLALERARSELAQAEQDLHVQDRSGESEIRIAEVELEKAQRRLSEAENAIETLSIKAPRNGIFIVGSNRWEGRKVQVGDEVWPGINVGSLPVLETMQVRTRLSDVDDGKMTVGTDVWCTLDSYPETRYFGTIESISEVAQEPDYITQRRFFDVIVTLRESDAERMRPGMSVQVEVPLEGIDNGLLVPRSAIDFGTQPPRVRLAGGRWSEVTLGPCSSTHCSVKGDLADGNRVEPVRGFE